jgi:hypothetical protein
MLSIHILAAILLAAHLGSGFYIGNVLRKQFQLLRLPIDAQLKSFRLVLLLLSITIFVGNFIPILVDAPTALGQTLGRPEHVKIISILYAVSNALTQLISAYMIHTLYRLAAADPEEQGERTEEALKRNKG